MRDVAASPNRRRRLLTDIHQIDWRPPTHQDAQDALLDAYLHAYGPVHTGDWAWWTGWGLRRSTAVLQRAVATGRAHPVVVDGLPEELWVTEGQADLPRPVAEGVHVLAYEDPSIKAYYTTRARYLRGVPSNSLFWHAGESMACALIDGLVCATWRRDRFGGLTIRWLRRLTHGQRHQVETKIRATVAWLNSQSS